MSQIYPSFLNALGQVNADGSEVFGSGGLASKTATGVYNIALDQPVDKSEISVTLGFIGDGAGGNGGQSWTWESVDDQNIKIRTFACADDEDETPTPCFAAADAAFSYIVFQKPSS